MNAARDSGPRLFLAQSTNSQQVLFIVVGGAILAWLYFKPRLQKSRDPLERSGSFASLSQQRAVERDMGNLLVELERMARTLGAQLDTRAAKLEALIAEADEKLARLERQGFSGKSDVFIPSTKPMMRLADSEPEEPNIEMPSSDTTHAEIYRLSDEGLGPPDIAKQLERPAGEIELILALRKRG